jgi:hypothetical protein
VSLPIDDRKGQSGQRRAHDPHAGKRFFDLQ